MTQTERSTSEIRSPHFEADNDLAFLAYDMPSQVFAFTAGDDGLLATLDYKRAVALALQILSIATHCGDLDPEQRAALGQIAAG